MRVGIRTDTQDFTGQVVSTEPELTVTDREVHQAFHRFLDVKNQSPPAYSALKHNGEPLYRLARRGTFIQKPPRRIHIYRLKVLEISLPDVRFEVNCSAGTYVRTICSDIGEALGCGAHMTGLCRTESGGFSLDEAISLDTLERLAGTGEISDRVIPMGDALRGMPCVLADEKLVRNIRQGHQVTGMEITEEAEDASPWIKVTDRHGNLVAVMDSTMKNGAYPYACVFPD
jgi:tRNA pseudouridine55 synthase